MIVRGIPGLNRFLKSLPLKPAAHHADSNGRGSFFHKLSVATLGSIDHCVLIRSRSLTLRVEP